MYRYCILVGISLCMATGGCALEGGEDTESEADLLEEEIGEAEGALTKTDYAEDGNWAATAGWTSDPVLVHKIFGEDYLRVEAYADFTDLTGTLTEARYQKCQDSVMNVRVMDGNDSIGWT